MNSQNPERPPSIVRPGPESTHFEDEKVIDLQEAFEMIMSKLPWVIAGTVIVTVIAAIYAFSAQSQYQAEGVLQVALSDRNFANVESSDEMSLTRDDILNTLVATMKSPEVFEKMEDQLNLTSNGKFLDENQTNQISQVKLNKILSSIIDVQLRRNTRLVDVSVKHKDPELAMELVNTFAESFVEFNGERKAQRAQAANQGLFKEAERLQEKVKTSEEELQDYVENQLDINIVEQRALINAKLTSLNADYTESLGIVQQLEGDLAKVEELIAAGELDRLLEVPAVRRDTAVKEARDNLLSQESLLDGLKDRFKEKHPILQDAQSKLKEYDSTLKSLLKSSPRWIESTLDSEKFRMQSTLDSIVAAQDELTTVDGKAIGYNALQRQIESDRAVYESVLTRLKELDVAKELDREVVTVEAKAVEAKKVWPRKPLILAGGFAGGLALSVGLVLFFGFLDHSLKTVDQAEQFLQLPALGAIPVKEKGDKQEKSGIAGERQVMISEPNSTCSESIRSMRATINMLGRREDRQVVLFTSAIPGEGKSFCCVNYAISLAQQGDKTLLIDLDLRRPSISGEFDLERSTPGVSNYVLDQTPLEELVTRKEKDKLHILTAGPKLPNPAEHLAGPHIEELIAEATTKYDRIILDTAPLNAVSDTMALLKYAQVLCLVVRAAKTHRKAVERPLEIMRRSGYQPSGFVLNFLPERPGYGSYYYYYYHGDEYRKGVYGSSDED